MSALPPTHTVEHVVQFSGGITSWAAARRVAEQHGTEHLTLLFADTRAEDEDLHRFNRDVERNLGVPITVVTDGRTPQQVFRDSRFLGNTRIAPCSHKLKQDPCRKWIEANTDPAASVLYLGIDWSEMHRIPSIERNWAPWPVKFPLCEPPYVDKQGWMAEARKAGIEPPRLYKLGFAHNNCGGACVRGGQAQWAHLLRTFPDRYADWETFEQEMRAELGADVSILRDRTSGETRPLTLRALRGRIEQTNSDQGPGLFDADDWGGCGCLTEVAA